MKLDAKNWRTFYEQAGIGQASARCHPRNCKVSCLGSKKERLVAPSSGNTGISLAGVAV